MSCYRFISLTALFLFISFISSVALAQIITTVAGTGVSDCGNGFSGEGGPATAASLCYPYDVVVDNNGNLFIADVLNHRIYQVNTAGNISTVAGTGMSGYNGDNILASVAELNYPLGLALDSYHVFLFIADFENHRVRMLDPGGIITTAAGSGIHGSMGADLHYPASVAVDSSYNLFIADTGNDRIRKVELFTGNISTVLGSVTGSLDPFRIAIDSSGHIFVADTNNHRVFKLDPAYHISTVAGTGVAGFSGDGGIATGAQLNEPHDVAVDNYGNVFIADTGNDRIRKVDTAGNISTVAGIGTSGFSGDGGVAIAAQLNDPVGIAVDSSGNLFIVDESNYRIRKVTPTPNAPPVANHFSMGIQQNQTVSGSLSAHDTNGDMLTYSIVNPSTNGLGTATIINSSTGAFTYTPNPNTAGTDTFIYKVNDGSVDSITATVTVTIMPMNNITTVAGSGVRGYNGDGGLPTATQFNYPHKIVLDNSGNLFIADLSNHRIRKVDTTGTVTTVAGTGTAGYSGDGGIATSARFNNPADIAVDSSGNLFIVDSSNHCIRKVNTAGNISTIAGTGTGGFSGDGGAATAAQLYYPQNITVDSSGNLLIADLYNHRIRKVDVNGNMSTVAGTGAPGYNGDGGLATAAQLRSPRDVAVDSSGNLLIADTNNSRIRKVDNTTRNISTIAGSGIAGFSGDGGPATAAQLNYPQGIALDSSGNLFIAEGSNHGIRKVDMAGNISTVAGMNGLGFSGDGGVATAAQLTFPTGIALDNSDNLLIADRNNQRIRKVTFNAYPVANDLSVTIEENQSISGNLSAYYTNGNALTYSIVNPSINGLGTATITDSSTGAFTYIPNVNTIGIDTFSYKVNHGSVDSATATVTITIN